MRQIIVIAHNIRSCHNVGSLLRTADGLGIERVYLTGYTPYPRHAKDPRLPHIANKIDRQIHKTALGAEHTVSWHYEQNILTILKKLKRDGYILTALEQTKQSQIITKFIPPDKIALVLGREVEGIESDVIATMDRCLEIPMFGQKESFNVVQAAAMALYHLKFAPFAQTM